MGITETEREEEEREKRGRDLSFFLSFPPPSVCILTVLYIISFKTKAARTKKKAAVDSLLKSKFMEEKSVVVFFKKQKNGEGK